MSANEIFNSIAETPAVRTFRQRIVCGTPIDCRGISRPAQPFFAAFLQASFPNHHVLVVTDGLKAQEAFQQDIQTWLRFGAETQASANAVPISPEPGQSALAARSRPPMDPLFYPAWEILPNDTRLPHADVISERLETLVALAAASTETAPRRIVVATVAALMQRTFAARTITERTRSVACGDRLDLLDLVEWLEGQGYEPEAQVTQKGELAMRGGILDVFPLTSPWPVRMEFFGDELESLRYFDPLTQISRETIARVILPPAGEIAILKKQAEGTVPSAGDLATLLDHFPPNTAVVLCEPEQLQTASEHYEAQIPENDPFFRPWEALRGMMQTRGMLILELREREKEPSPSAASEEALELAEAPPASAFSSGEINLPFSDLEAYRPITSRSLDPQIAEAERREFFVQLHRWLRQGYSVHVFCNNEGERDRFMEIWGDRGQSQSADGPLTSPAAAEAPAPLPGDARLRVHLGALARGFLYEPGKLAVVTDAEVFGRYKVQRPRRLKSPHARAARSALDIDFTDLEEGDYVVHLQHGIGRYLGLQVLPGGKGRRKEESANPEGGGEECLVIEYAASAADQPAPKLYVPVTEAHLVSKYVGTGKSHPPLNTLGGTRWAKAKAQAERAVRDLASELLSIQAARESQAGHPFPPDTTWQREFESAFLYEETADQLRSIAETKQDMESPKPMDRLICGDVGFGKTEVAIRAAFKAVLDGKQVAVLVPTTILARQHFNTFRERMADYPVRVEQLSRFRTRREQKEILRQLADGGVDIAVGTHRLLQEDVEFKDLGLVIVDEEQRFGVVHKEKLKQLRRLVDVLTLSATPIPRTLYLALTGARDMSTIETPPQDRLPVETLAVQYDERVIRDAIQRELNRGGQVFFLHNRIEDIESVALRIRALVPSARVLVGHGQMDSDTLEQVMSRFIEGEADVLVSTTIIESGIDIPNANTIIIDRADRFGLSDLYQLRGRVGRYKHQAYAYLLLPRHASLLDDVRKRISAMKQYSSLGSGFKIAMRDLEIRGAGNLLGPEQSGHITAVGFDLYCQLLKQSVGSLKGEKVRRRLEVELRLDFLVTNPGEEREQPPIPVKQETANDQRRVEAPRDASVGWRFVEESPEEPPDPSAIFEAVQPRTAACIPFQYISEARQRIAIYRKLAQAADRPALDELRVELRDRFGKMPAAMELLLAAAELKILASDRGIRSIETKGDKLMLQRNDDYLMPAGKFPRLVKKEAKARLAEIKKLLLALSQEASAGS